jgi:50S ribosomal protein L16 3-hydroxylase
VLEPGDLLYLPPGVAHHGVTLEPGMTFSVGFRAPTSRELLVSALRAAGGDIRYEDPPSRPARHPGEISPAALRALRNLATAEATKIMGPGFARTVGELLTEPKGEPVKARPVAPGELRRRLRGGASLVRAPGARLAFLRTRGRTLLFAEGRSFPLDRTLAFAAPLLTDRLSLAGCDLAPHLGRPGFLKLMVQLLESGALLVYRRRRPT